MGQWTVGAGDIAARRNPLLVHNDYGRCPGHFDKHSPPMTDTPPIHEWHAHVYFDAASTRAQAERVRAGIAQRFQARLGRWHEALVGPHTQSMYQVAFLPEVFEQIVPWLALNREGLSVLVHPDTGSPRADHRDHAIWMGTPLPIRLERLPVTSDPPGAI